MTDTMMVHVEICPECHGEGWVETPVGLEESPADATALCPVCKGSGEVWFNEESGIIEPVKRKPLITTFRPEPF